jgi:general secretion pathway protein M
MTLRIRLQQEFDTAHRWYRKLGAREQKTVSLSTIATTLLLMWALLLQPALNYGLRARADLDNERALLQWVQNHAEQVRQVTAARQTKPGGDSSLLALASNKAKDYQLSFQRFEPGADGKLALWLSDAEFNSLLTWLEAIVREHDVQIDRVNFSQSTRPGTVEAQITLRQ